MGPWGLILSLSVKSIKSMGTYRDCMCTPSLHYTVFVFGTCVRKQILWIWVSSAFTLQVLCILVLSVLYFTFSCFIALLYTSFFSSFNSLKTIRLTCFLSVCFLFLYFFWQPVFPNPVGLDYLIIALKIFICIVLQLLDCYLTANEKLQCKWKWRQWVFLWWHW